MTVTQVPQGSTTAIASGGNRLRSSHTPVAFDWTQVVSPSALESLLLGVRLRGWLGDRDKELLDSLAPPTLLIFLICCGRFVHPEHTELFPSEVIETAVREGGEAVFTHRYHTQNGGREGRSICTALLNPSRPQPWVLGYFGPDYQLDRPETHEQFHWLVLKFRQAYLVVAEIARDLARRQNPNLPGLIINRSSGRVVSVNKEAEKLLGESERGLVDLEFGQLQSRLASASHGLKTRMVNISRGNLYLTIIDLLHTQMEDDQDSQRVPKFLVERLAHQSVRLTQATVRLRKLSDQVPGDALSATARAVAEVAAELKRDIAKLH